MSAEAIGERKDIKDKEGKVVHRGDTVEFTIGQSTYKGEVKAMQEDLLTGEVNLTIKGNVGTDTRIAEKVRVVENE